ncbi:MAG: hypothetical protein EZS28_019348 [Streblomastix strix]|uniref:C2 DOCK-type domain-containing protein n=1 Tax=Streblomastix strix TaxID=222440 RepID=A0A5J4VRG1_9EUKA|nr:MAG: hypothetical protein EZS28_019348 [Streblomastix strix]
MESIFSIVRWKYNDFPLTYAVKLRGELLAKEEAIVSFKRESTLSVDMSRPNCSYNGKLNQVDPFSKSPESQYADQQISDVLDNIEINSDDFKESTYLKVPDDYPLSGRQLCILMYPHTQEQSKNESITGLQLDKLIPSLVNTSLYVNLRDCSFDGTIVEKLEPVFFTFALYSLQPRMKLSEDIHIDVNSDQLLQMVGLHKNQDDMKDSHDNQQLLLNCTGLTGALFPIDLTQVPDVNDVYLVFKINKTLIPDNDGWISDYTQADKVVSKYRLYDLQREGIKEKGLDKDLEKLKKKYIENCNIMKRYRQTFAFGLMHIIQNRVWSSNVFSNDQQGKNGDSQGSTNSLDLFETIKENSAIYLLFNQVFKMKGQTDESSFITTLDQAVKRPGDFSSIPAKLKIEFMRLNGTQFPRVITPDGQIQQAKQNQLDKDGLKTLILSQLKITTDPPRVVQSFIPPPIPLHPDSFSHFLYIYPDSVDFSKIQVSKHIRNIAIEIQVSKHIRNIAIEVRLKIGDEYTLSGNMIQTGKEKLHLLGGSNEKGQLTEPTEILNQGMIQKAFYSNTSHSLTGHRMDIYTSTAQYHNESPHFSDEIKLALPFELRKGLHILFTFYHISAQQAKDDLIRKEKKKKGSDDDRQVDNIVGFAILPLETEEDLFISSRNLNVYSRLEQGYMNDTTVTMRLDNSVSQSQIKYESISPIKSPISTPTQSSPSNKQILKTKIIQRLRR